MTSTNYAEPILYLLDKYKQSEGVSKINDSYISDGIEIDDLDIGEERNLATYPIAFIKDAGLVTAIKYGDDNSLTPEPWKQEFIRENGTVIKMVTTYIDGETITTNFIRDLSGITSIDIGLD